MQTWQDYWEEFTEQSGICSSCPNTSKSSVLSGASSQGSSLYPHCSPDIIIEKALSGKAGVEQANVNLASEKATVEYNPDKVKIRTLIDTILDAGYGVSRGREDEYMKLIIFMELMNMLVKPERPGEMVHDDPLHPMIIAMEMLPPLFADDAEASAYFKLLEDMGLLGHNVIHINMVFPESVGEKEPLFNRVMFLNNLLYTSEKVVEYYSSNMPTVGLSRQCARLRCYRRSKGPSRQRRRHR